MTNHTSKINKFFKWCIGIIFVLIIIYLCTLVNFLFKPLTSLISIVLLPLILSVFFYYLLRPLVDLLEKHKLNRSLAIILIYIAIAVILAVFVVGIWPSIRNQMINLVESAPSLFSTLSKKVQELEQNGALSAIFLGDINPLSHLTEYLNKGFFLITDYVTGLFSLVSNVTIALFTFPLILFYMLKEGNKFGRKLVSFVPKRFLIAANEVLDDIDSALGSFIVGRVVINLALGVLMYLGFLLIGLPYALLLTVVAVIMNFIPFVGAILSSIPIVIIGFIQSPTVAIWSLIVILLAQQIQDNIISPYIFGKQLDVHPLTVIILVLIGGDLAGITGIVLAIPLYMIIKVIFSKVYFLFYREKWENL
ncbi:AI-2E family transporter [Paenibacillus sp. FSL R10-2782]|uniref:AI-2E family transporter n=1 Tax=Paenibacillus terrae TaxID=159743 RepID=A0A4U2PQC4_9BACL|nr:AI-2E family transporter [Paenibacillus terrae]TKH41375.1 AI-2E family transporter [Paenibacillus terrae]